MNLLLLLLPAVVLSLSPKGKFRPHVGCLKERTSYQLTGELDAELMELDAELMAFAWGMPAVEECREKGGHPYVTFTCEYLANDYKDWFFWHADPTLYPIRVSTELFGQKRETKIVDRIPASELKSGSDVDENGFIVRTLGVHEGRRPSRQNGTENDLENHRLIAITVPIAVSDFRFRWFEQDVTKDEDWLLGHRED